MRRIEEPVFLDYPNHEFGVWPGGTIEAILDGDLVLGLDYAESVDQATGKVRIGRQPAFAIRFIVNREH